MTICYAVFHRFYNHLAARYHETVPAKPEDKAATLAKAMGSFGKGLGQGLSGQAGVGEGAVAGPVVRVARGNSVTVVPVGAR